MTQTNVQHRTLRLASPYIAKTEGGSWQPDFRHDGVYGLFHCEKNECVLSFPGPTSAHALSDGMHTVDLSECGLVCSPSFERRAFLRHPAPCPLTASSLISLASVLLLGHMRFLLETKCGWEGSRDWIPVFKIWGKGNFVGSTCCPETRQTPLP